MIQTTKDIIAVIEADQEESISRMLRDLIKEHRETERLRVTNLWDRYQLKNVPIKQRKAAAYEKVDRRTAHDFYADIVDTKTGYMGNMVTVSLDKEAYDDAALNRATAVVRRFLLDSGAEDLNSEVVRDAAACGLAYRLLYVPAGQNTVRMKNLSAREVIYIYDQSIDEPQLVLRYYELKDAHSERVLTAVEWYTDTGVRYYIDDGKLNFTLNTERGQDGIEPHMFSGIPIIPFPNNGEKTAEPEKVLDLIDTYDAIVSATASEVEQLRLAYMYVKGSGQNIDREFVETLEQTGIFGLDAEGEVGFVNKQLADTVVQNVLAEIRRNIYQFSNSIDMSKDFGGEMRVIGWQVALLPLENSSKITERKFTRALRKQYQLITDYWREFGVIDIDPYTIEIEFTRNFPRDIHGEAETLQLLLGAVSTQTAFSQMSFIDDADAEIRRMEEERSPYMMGDPDGDTRPTDERETG